LYKLAFVVFRGVDVLRRIVEQKIFSPLEVYDEKGEGGFGITMTDLVKESKKLNHVVILYILKCILSLLFKVCVDI